MKLTYRLQTIANLIDNGTNVIDVGCDHALLDIYLTLNKKNKCLALDINKGAINNAINNIKKYKLEDEIEIRINDGLENIDIPNNNTIVIAGMGTINIINMLKKIDIKKINNLIIQSNNNLYLLRKELVKLGFFIVIEKHIKDKNIYYTIIKFKRGNKKYKYYEYLFGINIYNKDYIEYLINKNIKIINKLPNKKFIKKFKLKKEIIYLKKIL